jgi:metallo-beta-lactamase family protein
MKDAHTAITQLEIVEEGAVVTPKHGCRVQFLPAGHIPGASMIQISGDHPTTLFSGDLGRPDDPLVPPPGSVDGVKNLIVESTYGGRKHPELDPEEQLAAVVNRTIERKGKVLIPAFAVGRTQRVLYHLYRLISSGRIPRVPVYLNSPLAAAATEVFRRYTSDPEALAAIDIAKPVESIEASIHLNYLKEPAIIIAGSGMATGGRIVHHIKSYGPDRRNTILLTGYQAAGTRGARLQKGATELKMFGIYVPIEAEVAQLHNLSAHADGDEILDWLRTFPRAPRQTWINHGSPEASDRLRQRIVEELGWRVHVPHYLETVSVNSL